MRDYEQMSLFEDIYPLFKIKKPIRLIELFGGIGSQAKALENLGADFSNHKLVEIDKYAVNSYNAVHGTDFKPCDIKSVTGASLEVRERERGIVT